MDFYGAIASFSEKIRFIEFIVNSYLILIFVCDGQIVIYILYGMQVTVASHPNMASKRRQAMHVAQNYWTI